MAMPRKAYLSKSKLMSGLQCAKRLWLEINHPELLKISAATERSFTVGHAVGHAARSLWPTGILIEHDHDLKAALQETEAYLEQPGPVTLLEATLQADGVLIRADILDRNADGEFRLIEVKAATSVKPPYAPDCAIQTWVLEQLGLKPTRVELAHVNNQFVYPGDGNYDGLLTNEDMTDEVEGLLEWVPEHVAKMRDMLSGGQPDIAVGRHCKVPYECPFIDHCTPAQAEYPIACLPGSKAIKAELIAEGYEDIRDIPAGRLSSDQQERVRRITASGTDELLPAAESELRALPWPRYYFDFETLGVAVPFWVGTRPYQAQPFQWSCHVENEAGDLCHREFLADGADAPMRECAESLIEALGDTGPIFVYTGYEKDRLVDLTELFPDLAGALQGIIDRLYDLHPLTKTNYYHPDMRGSWSLKKVLPAVAPDLTYDGLEIVSEGTEAEAAYMELLSPSVAPSRREAVRTALLEYCKLDTLGLVRLARHLQNGSAAQAA